MTDLQVVAYFHGFTTVLIVLGAIAIVAGLLSAAIAHESGKYNQGPTYHVALALALFGVFLGIAGGLAKYDANTPKTIQVCVKTTEVPKYDAKTGTLTKVTDCAKYADLTQR